jgi:High potential iron-sulfur protein
VLLDFSVFSSLKLENFMPINRRVFLMTVPAATAVLGTQSRAQTKLDEKDSVAVALGYVAESSRADSKKYPRFATGQNCASCALFQGKAGDKLAACPLFAGKQVAATAWCSAWAKKA